MYSTLLISFGVKGTTFQTGSWNTTGFKQKETAENITFELCSTSQIPSLKILNYTLLNMKFLFLFMLTKAHDPTRRSGTFSFRLILLIVNNSKEKFQSEISKNNIYFVQRKASRNQWISECIKTNDAGNSQSTRLLQYLRRSSVFPVRLFVDMPHDLPCILSCD